MDTSARTRPAAPSRRRQARMSQWAKTAAYKGTTPARSPLLPTGTGPSNTKHTGGPPNRDVQEVGTGARGRSAMRPLPLRAPTQAATPRLLEGPASKDPFQPDSYDRPTNCRRQKSQASERVASPEKEKAQERRTMMAASETMLAEGESNTNLR